MVGGAFLRLSSTPVHSCAAFTFREQHADSTTGGKSAVLSVIRERFKSSRVGLQAAPPWLPLREDGYRNGYRHPWNSVDSSCPSAP